MAGNVPNYRERDNGACSGTGILLQRLPRVAPNK